MDDLLGFLTDIAINPKQQTALAIHPDILIDTAGLSEADRAVVKSRSSEKIAAVFANELTTLAVLCADPNPDDPLPDPDPPSEPDPSEDKLDS
jgi:hypothetical protein